MGNIKMPRLKLPLLDSLDYLVLTLMRGTWWTEQEIDEKVCSLLGEPSMQVLPDSVLGKVFGSPSDDPIFKYYKTRDYHEPGRETQYTTSEVGIRALEQSPDQSARFYGMMAKSFGKGKESNNA